MIDIIETNLLMKNSEITDHQSRVISVESWEDYIDELKQAKSVERQSCIGNLHGYSIIPESEVYNLKFDDFHASCDVKNKYGVFSKKLAMRI